MNIKASLLAAGALATLSASLTAQITVPLYSTGFDLNQGYVAGNISGQNGWAVFQTSGTAVFAQVTTGAPSGFGGTAALRFTSGINGNTSPRYAWGPD